MKKFQHKYRIQSARAQWHDYNGGAYFISICTARRKHYFGLIDDGVMIYSPIGKFLNENLQNVAVHYPYAEIPVFQVMPNHVHVIVFIDKPVDTVMGSGADNINNAERPENNGVDLYCGDCRDAARRVSTIPATTNAPSNATANAPFNAEIPPTVTDKNEKMRDIAVNRGRLSTVIGGLKSATTHFANNNKIPFGWQERFHDHIIRDVDELNRIATYIENNPRNWKGDTFYL
jgi:REP element-mobilizing transposase RayT